MPHPDYLGAILVVRPLDQSHSAVPTETQTAQVTIVRRAVEHPLVRLVYGLSTAAAAGVSYAENQSIPWAIGHAIIGPAYLAYAGWKRFAKPAGSATAWDAKAKLSLVTTRDLESFEADDQTAAWQRAVEIAEEIPWQAWEPDLKEAYGWNTDEAIEVSDVYEV
jgi:hypothetical protein